MKTGEAKARLAAQAGVCAVAQVEQNIAEELTPLLVTCCRADLPAVPQKCAAWAKLAISSKSRQTAALPVWDRLRGQGLGWRST